MQVTYGARTDTGAVRDLNEDAVCAQPPVFAVADGMGGHAAGEVASALAIRCLEELALRGDVHADDVLNTMLHANQIILDRQQAQADTAGMGTTVSGLCLGLVGGAPHWLVFNVGDSRVYHFSDGTLRQLTTDHSEVAELVAAGTITPEQALTHPMRNVITRSLGTQPPPTTDLWLLPVVEGERFLVCSDGLPLEVSDSAIASALSRGSGAQATADMLVAKAVAAGGRDNVSVVVVDVAVTNTSQPVDVATAPRSGIGAAS